MHAYLHILPMMTTMRAESMATTTTTTRKTCLPKRILQQRFFILLSLAFNEYLHGIKIDLHKSKIRRGPTLRIWRRLKQSIRMNRADDPANMNSRFNFDYFYGFLVCVWRAKLLAI